MPECRLFKFCLFLFAVSLFEFASPCSFAQVDPVTDFIIRADSLAQAGGDELLAPYVADRAILVGAVVGQLLDVAFEIGEAGDKDTEEENVAFAERLARLHHENTGSDVPLRLVMTYRSWTPEMRAIRSKAKTLEAEAFEVRGNGDYDRAVELFNEVLDHCRKIDDRRLTAVTWGSLGVVHWHRQDMAAVEASYNEALDARRSIEDRILEGRTLNGLGSTNWRRGNFEKAADYYGQAADLRRKTGDFGALGISLTYRGNAFLQMNRFLDARQCYEEAYSILRVYGSPAQMIEILNSIASVYADMGQLNDANDMYRQAIEIAAEVDRPQDEASVRTNLANNLRLQGKFTEALEQLDVVPSLLERQPEPEKTVIFHRERGLTYLDMGELDGARTDLVAYAEQARLLENPTYQIEALLDLCEFYRELGAIDLALDSANRALTLIKELDVQRYLATAYVNLSRLEHLKGNIERALELRTLSLETNRSDEALAYALEDEIAIAGLKAVLGDNDEARRLVYDALPSIRETGDNKFEQAAHFALAHSFEKDNPDSAAWHYEKALSSIEESRIEVGGVEVRTRFLSGERRFYYEEVARYYASFDLGKEGGDWSRRAFHTIERAKARGLLDMLERPVSMDVSPAEKAVLDSLYQHTGDTPADKKRQRQLEERYVELRDKRVNDAVGRLRPEGAVTDIDQVRKALGKKMALLEYALGDTTSLLWVIDGNGHEVLSLPNRSELRLDVQRLRDAIQRPGAGDAVLRGTARLLYTKLILPAERRIEKAERLVIVPDGVLYELPFEVLLTEEPSEGSDWNDLPYLTRSYDTVYSPSASIFARKTEDKKRRYDMELLAFGDPDFSLFTQGRGTTLDELPNTRIEVEHISAFVDDRDKRIYLGSEASEANLRNSLGAGTPRVLHMATHGLIDPIEPVSSSVVLSPDTVTGDDGYLHTLEILSMPLDIELVVLSACESARGTLERGEGVVGLCRAFMASGSRGVVASLWAVSDASTARLMSAFYEKMYQKKTPPAEALSAARLSLIEDSAYGHPFYWSPFVLTGTVKTR